MAVSYTLFSGLLMFEVWQLNKDHGGKAGAKVVGKQQIAAMT